MIRRLFGKIDRQVITKLSLLTLSLLISALIILNRHIFSELKGYGLLGIFLISIIGNSTVVVPAPVFLTALVGGGLFNPLIVGVISALGAAIGELTSYMAGFGGEAFIKDDAKYKKIKSWLTTNGFLTIFILAAIPNPLFDIAGLCAGVMKYPVKKFWIATLLGKIIKFTLIALIGAYSI